MLINCFTSELKRRGKFTDKAKNFLSKSRRISERSCEGSGTYQRKFAAEPLQCLLESPGSCGMGNRVWS
jgi:hypothetical protein